ncbi:hypothetical protein HAX54_033381 [Datura stramonium]|uniref:Putative plant transposon protein domain-containing protein n=1 Tax=Datura stramonium TaxID=4076 RepID=A0ABS8VCW3_DATST|nr:hypothetical protein [Datura stramonium]
MHVLLNCWDCGLRLSVGARLETAVPAAPTVPRGQHRQYETRWVIDEGKKWYAKHKETKYFPEEQIARELLTQEFPRIVHWIDTVGLNFIFEEPRECNLHLIREFYANWNPTLRSLTVKIRGQVVTFEPHHLNAILGARYTDAHFLRQLNITPPYADIKCTLCGARSTARWDRHKERGYHQTLPYSQMNQEARIWLKIVCSCRIPGVHMSDVIWDRVFLVYALMKRL